jgi:hypothetical protein
LSKWIADFYAADLSAALQILGPKNGTTSGDSRTRNQRIVKCHFIICSYSLRLVAELGVALKPVSKSSIQGSLLRSGA